MEVEEVVAISDPGEVGKAEHNPGDRFVVKLSNIAAWLFPALMLAICAQVLLRNAGMNQAWLDDLQWWMYGAAVLMGVGYAVTTDSHVRVDVLYDNYTPAKQTRISIFAIGWLFLPFILLAWDVTLFYAVSSVVANEGSDSPNGLHNLWILKVFMNLTFVFIAFASWAALIRLVGRLYRPTLSRVLFNAIPAVFFTINLIVWHVAMSGTLLFSAEGTTARDVGRLWFFDEVEVGPYDIKVTVIVSVVATIVVLALARVLDSNKRAEG